MYALPTDPDLFSFRLVIINMKLEDFIVIRLIYDSMYTNCLNYIDNSSNIVVEKRNNKI